jgi:hypothetical protein
MPYKGLKYEQYLKQPRRCDFQGESASWDLWNSCNTLAQFWQLNDVTSQTTAVFTAAPRESKIHLRINVPPSFSLFLVSGKRHSQFTNSFCGKECNSS